MKKRGLSLLLAILMVVAVFSPIFPFLVIEANALGTNSYQVELAFNNLFVFEEWASNDLSTTIIPQPEKKVNDKGEVVLDDEGKPVEVPYGELTTDVESGSVNITILRDAPASYGGIYTAHGGDATNPKNNENYYAIDVDPDTTYTFSYTLANTNYAGFNAIVFYFDAENKYINMSAAAATTLNGTNSWSFTTPANADRIQIRFTVGNAGREATGTIKDIIICKSETLTPGNLFDFNSWSSNEKSGGGIHSVYNGGTSSINSSNKSITLTTSAAFPYLFTNFSMDASDPAGNKGYYTIDVAPSTTYTLQYSITDYNLESPAYLQPHIAMYSAEGLFLGYENNASVSWSENKFTFTTYSNAARVQIIFAIVNLSSVAGLTATVRDIAFCKTENLFNYSEWAGNSNSASRQPYYNGGTLSLDQGKNSLTLTTDTSVAGGDVNFLFTNFSTGSTNGYYTVDVQPGKKYSLCYKYVDTSTVQPANFLPHIALYDKAGNLYTDPNTGLYYINHSTVGVGYNTFTFTVPENVYHIEVVFALYNFAQQSGLTATIKDVYLYDVAAACDFEVITGTPHRETYTYTYNGENAQYGELPVANAPDGYVFSGWFTGENGSGERITPETYVRMDSCSVFAYYEPKVDKLELVTAPNKTTYTVGEKLNTAGLSLKATQYYQADVTDENGNPTGETETKERIFYINSKIYCTPEYLKTVGTQTITAHYGGKTVTFNVNVLAAD